MRVIGVNLIVSKRILESFPTFYPGQDYLLVRCTNGGASDRIVWVHVQYLIKKVGGDIICSASNSVWGW